MSKTFDNIEEMLDYLEEHPEEVVEQNIGEIIEIDCPVCEKTTEAEIINSKTARCRECESELTLKYSVQ